MDTDLLSIPAVETHMVRSTYVNQVFKIQVMQPPRRAVAALPLPVIYVTDGNLMFDVLKGLSYSMHLYDATMPRFILVAIGYPGESPATGSLLRMRDLTFPGYPQFDTKLCGVQDVPAAECGSKDFFGAADFQAFVASELIPFVNARYQTVPDQNTYFGHSAGGSFGLFTLFSHPGIFRNYILSSPALIYHGQSSAGVHYHDHDFALELARSHIASGKSFGRVHIFMSVGTEEEFESDIAPWRFTSSFYRMVSLLKQVRAEGFRLTTEVFSGASHGTVWPMAFVHGTRAVVRSSR